MHANQVKCNVHYFSLWPYSYDRQLGIFYTHYHIDTITHGKTLAEPVGSTGLSNLVRRIDQSEWNTAGAYHQSPDPRPC